VTADAPVASPSRGRSDAELIARARVEPAAFAPIFDRHYPTIHAYLRRRLDATIAEELAAETFARALRAVTRYDDDRGDALPWLFGIAMDAIHRYYIGDERFTTAQLRDFDPTPQELFDRLRSRVGDRGQSPDGEVFVEIADALREAPQPPRLRATLYRALALVPGVQLLGDVKDRLGRAAVGVAFTEHTGLRQELLFDPQTSEVLNEREVVARPVQGIRAPVGTAIEDVVYTERAVTDATTRP
jgi:DNA-directed RNA polymerase specialized sigma24 family protein